MFRHLIHAPSLVASRAATAVHVDEEAGEGAEAPRAVQGTPRRKRNRCPHVSPPWRLHLHLSVYLSVIRVCSVCQNEQYRMKLHKSNERLLALVKSSLDIVVAVGLLQLAPKKVTPRVTGAFGFASSLIACYQVGMLVQPVCRPGFVGSHAFCRLGSCFQAHQQSRASEDSHSKHCLPGK